MYSASDLPEVNRTEAEKNPDHPFLNAWANMRVNQTFAREEVRDTVGPAYMGLIKELDDQIGRLLEYLEKSAQMKNTMIVFTSDHGENLGDHWLGEKDLFFDCNARVPLIIYDPRQEADKTRGTSTDHLVEAIDLVPTFIEALGGTPPLHILEGRSLQPLLHYQDPIWREYCVSEYDYATRDACSALQIDERDARLVMIFDGRWKYVHIETMHPLLYDLKTDPGELMNLGNDSKHASQIARLSTLHFEWARRHHSRITLGSATINAMAANKEPPGILIGYWDQKELEADGKKIPSHLRNG